MRQRVLQATLVTVLLAVLILGIPLAASWVMYVEKDLQTQVRDAARDTVVEVDRMISEGESLDVQSLEPLTQWRQGQYDLHITVNYEDTQISVGEDPGASDIVSTYPGEHGELVTVTIPQSDRNRAVASAWVLIAIAGLSALAIAVSVALWQAQRLSAPLAILTKRAEELGSGRARKTWEASGIPEIDKVATELARSGTQLNERLEAERTFSSDASHQLRTPLTALSMRIDEIVATSDQDEVREEARISLDQIDRLTTVVNDLINRPRASQRRTPGIVELGPVLKQQSEEWSPAFTARRRELVVQVPKAASVWAAQGPLTQVIATLIENSLVHGDGRTTLKVRRNSRSTVIEVADQGGGVDAELGQAVFERSVSGRTSQGTGVGLALARNLIEDLGGRLELLVERPAKFGVFLITAPSQGDDDPEAELEIVQSQNTQPKSRSGRFRR